MAYITTDDPNFITDIIKRKEFYWYKRWDKPTGNKYENIIPRFLLEDAIAHSNNLRLTSYQEFISNFVNPNTPYKRTLMKWDTGTGKSIGALTIAMKFIQHYRVEQKSGNEQIGSVFIIGFAERVFKNELMRFPEFGFVSKKERAELDRLKKVIASGSAKDIQFYREMVSRIKRRIINRKGNGFFRFFGYKAFVNRILVTGDLDINSMTEKEIRQAIEKGKITYNEELMAQFKNSLMICDEIHNVYNSLEKNNWGIAIQAVLDHEPSCRAVFASATPLNNTPTEIIDLLNLLLTKEERLKKSDFFTPDQRLLPGALDKIAKLSAGHISYLRDVNPKYYPEVIAEGEQIAGIPYLHFTRCPMSELHYNTYKKIYTGVLSQDSQYLMDFIIENPQDMTTGLYQTNAIKVGLQEAPASWRDKYGFSFVNGKITGNALHANNLEKYSSKYFKMLETIHHIIKTGGGKIFIYHNIVHMSGVLFIEQVLLKNGFLDEFGGSTDFTVCVQCGKYKYEHLHTTHTAGFAALPSIHGGKDKQAGKQELIIVKEKNPAGQSVDTVMSGDNFIISFVKSPEKYTAMASSMHNDLLNCRSYILKNMHHIYDQLENIPIEVQVPNHAVRLIDWFLHSGFKFVKQTSQHTIMSLPIGKVSGGRVKPSKAKKMSKPVGKLGKPSKASFGLNVKIEKNKGSVKDHVFIPARFILVHSEVEKNNMEHSIDKFNGVENTNGHRFMILLGSKIMKESHDIKAIQHILIMSKPDNIPTLIQIRGRAIRKNSHRYLPLERQKVHVYIFTTCLPIKIGSGRNAYYDTSYEEDKYKEKVKSYMIIQQIEQVMHENAVDALTNQEYTNRVAYGEPDQLDALPFVPNIPPKYLKELPCDDINTDTFTVYYLEQEINIIIVMIKRFFIEYSSVWEHTDLLNILREDPLKYHPDLNTKILSEKSFLVALSRLTYYSDKTQYIEPLLTQQDKMTTGGTAAITGGDGKQLDNFFDNFNSMIDKQVGQLQVSGGGQSAFIPGYDINQLFDVNDKIITLPNGQKNIIVPILNDAKQYYMLFPIDDTTQQPIIDIDLPYRVIHQVEQTSININMFVRDKKLEFDYDEKKQIFYRKYIDVSLENMENVVCEYGTTFHIKFIEECVEYVFRTWTDPTLEKDPLHDFYFKMLYYYDLLSLIMWAYTAKPKVFRQYTKYAIPVRAMDIKLKTYKKYEKRAEELDDISPDDTSDMATSGVVNLLKTSINRTSNVWIPREFREEFDKILKESEIQFSILAKKRKAHHKVSAKLLPIGHYISKYPRIYHPSNNWIEDPAYMQNDQRFVENNDIVGYDEKSKTGVHVRFKIRNPIHNIKKFKDTRLIEKGTVCKSKSKSYLRMVAKKLDIILPEKFNVDDLCLMIKSKLIRLELKERIKKSNIKYFYFHYEQQLGSPD